MKPVGEMTAAELAAYVQSHLATKGIRVVLSGGACVSIYSSNQYVSLDLDLVNVYMEDSGKIRQVMEEIGFSEQGRHFAHEETDLLIDFPPGPLSVGEEPVSSVVEMEFSTGTLRIISPTDCVKDRLAAYYHWNDLQGLEQAVLVARSNRIDIDEIGRWSAVEGVSDRYEEIRSRLER